MLGRNIKAKVLTPHFSSQHQHLSNNSYDYVFGFVVDPITLTLLLNIGGKIAQKITDSYEEKSTKSIQL